MISKDQEIIDEILKTLSFFEPMTLEFIFLDFDDEFLMKFKRFSINELKEYIQFLQDENIITLQEIEGQKAWIKTYPTR